MAQTLAAAGRAGGPFISGTLFSVATHIKPKGEALPFGIFAGVSLVGFVLSMGIRPRNIAGGSRRDDANEGVRNDDERTALMS